MVLSVVKTYTKKKFDELEKINTTNLSVKSIPFSEFRQINYTYVITNLLSKAIFDMEKITKEMSGRLVFTTEGGAVKISRRIINSYLDRSEFINIKIPHKIELFNINKKNKLGEYDESNYSVYLPMLINGRYFILSNNKYIPGIIMGDAPVRIKEENLKFNLPTGNITFDFKKDELFKFMDIRLNVYFTLAIIYGLYNSKNENEEDSIIENLYRLYEYNFYKFKKGKNIKSYRKFKDELIEAIDDDRNIKMLQRIYMYVDFFAHRTIGIFNPSKIDYQKLFNTFFRIFMFGLSYNRKLLKRYLGKDYSKGGAKIVRKIVDKFYINNRDLIYEYDLHNDNNLLNRRLLFMDFWIKDWIKLLFKLSLINSELYYRNNEIYTTSKIVKKDSIVSLFNREGFYLYDYPTPYSAAKAMIVKNYNSDNIPLKSKLLDDTQYNIICPIATSSSNPGETLYILPETNVDVFGYFTDIFEILDIEE